MHIYLYLGKLTAKEQQVSNKFLIFATENHINDKIMATDKVAYWLDIADEDLGVAEDLYKAKRWLYVAFMCHQSIEKTLKSYWCATQPDAPPYTHNHKRLADGND